MTETFTYTYLRALLHLFRLNGNFKRNLRLVLIPTSLIILLSMILVYNLKLIIIFSLFCACVASMLHLRYIPWLGVDLNTVLTVYASMNFGLLAGIFIGNASLVGILISGDVDNNIFIDLMASYIVAFVASLFTIAYFVPVVIGAACCYFAFCMIFHTLMGTFDIMNITWTITNFIWVLFLMLKIVPVFF